MDIRQKLNFNDNSIDLIYSSHMLEHLTADEGFFFLRECHRILRSGGVVRIAVPDADKLIKYYQSNQLSMFDEINDGCSTSNFESAKLWSLLFEGHRIAYDFAGLKSVGENAGFVVEKKMFNQGTKQIVSETIDMLPEISLFVEMTKI